MKTVNLNCSESNILLDMIQSLIFCEDIDQFIEVASLLEKLTGCRHVIFGTPGMRLNGETSSIHELNISYPQEWVDLYQTNEFWRIDPVIRAAVENAAPQHWVDIYRRNPPDKEFLKLAYDFGIKYGYTCVQGKIGKKWMILSLVGDFKTYSNRINYILERITPHFLLAYSSIRANHTSVLLQNLTKKEKEVLAWLHQGKSSWEISIVLRVSEATINFHIKNIKEKLQVVSRIQAVAMAIHGGLICL